jgi:hypothetical protein
MEDNPMPTKKPIFPSALAYISLEVILFPVVCHAAYKYIGHDQLM